jgi:hypothetical protein
MHGKTKRKFIVFALLMAGLCVSLPRPVLAKATKTDVTGVSDVNGCVLSGEIVPDEDGNLHIKAYTQTGRFELQGDDIAIKGTQIVVLTGVIDDTGSGFIDGNWIVISASGTVIWEGAVHGHLEQFSFTGKVTAQGKGPYAGMTLKLDMQERPGTEDNPNSEVFDLSGHIRESHRS